MLKQQSICTWLGVCFVWVRVIEYFSGRHVETKGYCWQWMVTEGLGVPLQFLVVFVLVHFSCKIQSQSWYWQCVCNSHKEGLLGSKLLASLSQCTMWVQSRIISPMPHSDVMMILYSINLSVTSINLWKVFWQVGILITVAVTTLTVCCNHLQSWVHNPFYMVEPNTLTYVHTYARTMQVFRCSDCFKVSNLSAGLCKTKGIFISARCKISVCF